MNKFSAKVYRTCSALSTRRQFLQGVIGGTAAAAAMSMPWPAWAQTDTKVRRSRVALLENPRILTDGGIRRRALTEMLEDGLCIALRQTSAAAAWQSLLKKDDRILLKFNRADAERLNISTDMVTVLVESMMRAGLEARQITLVEATSLDSWAGDLAKAPWGWSQRSYDFGSGESRGSEQLIKAAEEATAIINVPFLKAHRIAGMTGCLKNLSHGLIRRPALYHANQCCPYIPDIVNMPVIRDKLRLNIVNAIRVIYDTRPDATRDPLGQANTLLLGTDPVAVDTIGQTVLDSLRQEKGLQPTTPEPGMVQQHRLAAEKGLGINNAEYIDVVRPVVL